MAYKYIAGSTELPITQVNEGDVHDGSGMRRAGIRVTLNGVPTAKQLKALMGGRIAMQDEQGTEQHAFEGYTRVLNCEVTLAQPDDAEAAIEAAQAATEAVSAQHAALARLASSFILDEEALEHADVWPEWKAGQAYRKEEVVRHGDGLYRVAQAHTSQSHQPPGGAGMLAVYRPVQVAAEGEVLPWVSGEALDIGDRRVYDGVVYEVYGAAGANVWFPPDAPSVWRVVTE